MIHAVLTQVIGYSIFAALLYGVGKANARRWTRLARVYADPSPRDLSASNSKRMQTAVLVGGNVGWNSYGGITTVGVSQEGISFRIMAPFSFFHTPLLIPFRDIQVDAKRWYLFGKSFQLTLKGVDDVRIILCEDLLNWIQMHVADLTVELPAEPPSLKGPPPLKEATVIEV